jgi:hypothetical protein
VSAAGSCCGWRTRLHHGSTLAVRVAVSHGSCGSGHKACKASPDHTTSSSLLSVPTLGQAPYHQAWRWTRQRVLVACYVLQRCSTRGELWH